MSLFNGLVDLGTTAYKGATKLVGDGWDWMAKGDNMRNVGQLVGGLGGAYGAYTQSKQANKMLDLQKDAYKYNKSLSEREKKRQEEAEMALSQGFDNSGFGA